MKIEISKIRVVGGEFRILAPDDSGLNPPDQQESTTLIVGCRYSLTDKNGVSIAEGTASNSPVATGSTIELSTATLEAFNQFFNSLEHDVANALESKEDDNKQRALESILAGKIPGQS